MSNVWATRHRLFVERLRDLAEWLSADTPRAPTVLEQHTVRLLAVAVILLRQHQIDKRGQCQFCGWTRRKWRFWRWQRRCTVHQALDLAMSQSLDVVWWQVFARVGQGRDLAQVREWMAERAADTDATAHERGNDEPTQSAFPAL